MPARNFHLLFSCEHGGCRIPKAYTDLFNDQALLQSHRGWDAGALELARQLARTLDAPLHAATTSRLLVDLNRSPHHRHLFSEFTQSLDASTRSSIVEKYYRPYRDAVEKEIRQTLKNGRTVLHISVHSFSPVMHGEIRFTDIGLLYDPGRVREKAFCGQWRNALHETAPYLKVRRNHPYTGVQDGFVTALRKQFSENDYIGVELETNQRFALEGGRAWIDFRKDIVTALRNLLSHQPSG